MFGLCERSPEKTERAGDGLDVWHASVATLRPKQAVDEEEEDESEFRLAGRHGSGCQEGDRRSERLAEHAMLQAKAGERCARHDVNYNSHPIRCGIAIHSPLSLLGHARPLSFQSQPASTNNLPTTP